MVFDMQGECLLYQYPLLLVECTHCPHYQFRTLQGISSLIPEISALFLPTHFFLSAPPISVL